MVEHRRDDAARAARRGRYDGAAGSVLLRSRQRIGVNLGAGFQRVGVALRFDPVGAGFAGDFKPSGQYAVVVQAALDRLAHHGPYLVEVIPDFGTFAVGYVFPVSLAFVAAPRFDLADGSQRVDAVRRFETRRLVCQRTSADAVDGPAVRDIACLQPFEQHAVGVEGQHDLRFPNDFGWSERFQHREDRGVGKVAFAGGSQRPVQRHAVGVRIVTAFGETFGGFLGPHRVAARRAVAYFVQLLE